MTRIALLGDLDRAYVTHRALEAVAGLLPDGVAAEWVGSDTPQARDLAGFDGVWAVPGTPYRDDDAVLAAIGGWPRSAAPRRSPASTSAATGCPAAPWRGSRRRAP